MKHNLWYKFVRWLIRHSNAATAYVIEMTIYSDLMAKIKYIANGNPLDSVLDEIRAEITRRHLSINEKSEFDNGRTYAYEEVIDVIDKYKEGGANETDSD